jgi:putative Mg2+ transporter-C (MgtC) family protein
MKKAVQTRLFCFKRVAMDFNADYETGIRLLISFIIGAAIGFEREYHSKAAGLRTMIMICLGSTIFTEVSMSIGTSSPDRIASNIITGIGFLGAGVIFKDGLSITGITTATTIWICAALGMAVGAGEYFIALLGSVIVMLVLSALSVITKKIESLHQARSYVITYAAGSGFRDEFEKETGDLTLKFLRRKDFKDGELTIIMYEIFGGEEKLDKLNNFLKKDQRVKKYEY